MCFQRLKARFRILKTPLSFHDKKQIDDLFFTCVTLQNLLLDWDVGSGRVLGAPFILSSGANVANTKKDLPSSPITSMALAEDAEAPVLYTAAKASRGSTSGVVREWNLHRRVQTRVFNVEAEVPWGVCVARGLLFVACNDSCTRMWSTRGSSRMCDVPGACTVS